MTIMMTIIMMTMIMIMMMMMMMRIIMMMNMMMTMDKYDVSETHVPRRIPSNPFSMVHAAASAAQASTAALS